MPKILSYTPSWLSRPNPGFQVFKNHNPSSANAFEKKYSTGDTSNVDGYVGPDRTIARRGAEIFVVVGNQIRWADLTLLKEGLEQLQATPSKGPRTTNGHTIDKEDGPDDGSYRILKVGSIYGPIHQLSISPNGNLLAIATSHTVHLVILPDSSHLGQFPNHPIKLKTSTIGRTTHVVSQSQIASILWHPFGLSGSCLVTVTADAAVRLWEFDEGNRYASDTPSLAIDLKKLALGTSDRDNFAPERGRNRAYSLDSIGMEVASACFGGSGVSDESPWSAMTLWVGMKGGDIYALCPLLPSKWQAPATILPSLSTATVAKAAAANEEASPNAEAGRLNEDQYRWIQELDGQESKFADGQDDFSDKLQVFRRPEHPSPTPRLQGPFQLTSRDDDENLEGEEEELSDVYVIASKIDSESLEDSDTSDSGADVEEPGLSTAVICLLTRSGKVYVCLDLEGVEGQWLPHEKPEHQLRSSAEPYIVFLEELDTMKPGEAEDLEWPTFTGDVNSRYSFFTTHSHGIFFFSFDPWIQSLENELKSADSTGSAFRLDVFRNGAGTLRERILSINYKPDIERLPNSKVPSCVVLEDSDLGYFLLTTHNDHPLAAILDRPLPLPVHEPEFDENDNDLPDLKALAIGPARSAYEPASAFYAPSEFASAIDQKVPARHKHLLSQQVRLSPATLDLMTEAHRVLSRETHHLGIAAADLFRRCERLIDELRDQISRVEECAVRGDNLLKGNGYPNDKWTNIDIRNRIEGARDKQVELQERHEALKKKLHGAGGRKLSEKEKAWAKEVERTSEAIRDDSKGGRAEKAIKEEEDVEDEGDYDDEEAEDDEDEKKQFRAQTGVLKKRLEEVHHLKDILLSQADDIIASADETLPQNRQQDDSQILVPQDLKARKMAHVTALLERETSMIDAASKRLEQLNFGPVS